MVRRNQPYQSTVLADKCLQGEEIKCGKDTWKNAPKVINDLPESFLQGDESFEFAINKFENERKDGGEWIKRAEISSTRW